MKKIIAILSCLFLVHISSQTTLSDSSWRTVVVTTEQCRTFGIAEIAFNISFPKEFGYEFHHKPTSAIRIFKTQEGKIESEIAITTMKLADPFTAENEKKWLEEFKRFPEIQDFPDLSVDLFDGFDILSGPHSYYVMRINNESGKYPKDIPLNSVGIPHPAPDGYHLMIIVLSKYDFDARSPLTDEEKGIINSLRIEDYPGK